MVKGSISLLIMQPSRKSVFSQIISTWNKLTTPVSMFARCKSSASSKRWNARQSKDKFTLEARVEGYKSRAAFKLIELNSKHKLLLPGMTVVDLGFAPGAWTQVAVQHTKPGGRVIGVDILPCRPPEGASSLQGNFLGTNVQEELKKMIISGPVKKSKKILFADEIDENEQSYLDLEKAISVKEDKMDAEILNNKDGHLVDLILSDMCEPLPQTHGFWARSINDPYIRMANTTGNKFRDHGMSIV